MIMAHEITKLNMYFEYLFVEGAYKSIKDKQRDLINEILAEVASYKSFFEKIKNSLSEK